MEHKQILLMGFGLLEEKLRALLEPMGLEVLTCGPSYLPKTVGEIFLSENPGSPEEAMERGLVMFHNFAHEDLDPVLKVLREAEIPTQPYKAMVTPTNWHWTVEALLSELQQEQLVMGELIKLKKLRDSMPMPAFTDIPAMKARMMAEAQLSGGEEVTVETIRRAYEQLEKYAK